MLLDNVLLFLTLILLDPNMISISQDEILKLVNQ